MPSTQVRDVTAHHSLHEYPVKLHVVTVSVDAAKGSVMNPSAEMIRIAPMSIKMIPLYICLRDSFRNIDTMSPTNMPIVPASNRMTNKNFSIPRVPSRRGIPKL